MALILGFSLANVLLLLAWLWNQRHMLWLALCAAAFVAGPLLFYTWCMGPMNTLSAMLRTLLLLVLGCFEFKQVWLRSDVDGFANPLTPLAVLGPFVATAAMCLLFRRHWRRHRFCHLPRFAMVVTCSGLAATGFWFVYQLEAPRLELQEAILRQSKAHEQDAVVTCAIFQSPFAKETIGRLCFSPQQHTSASTFCSSGPMDVMGPACFFINDRRIPIEEIQSPLRNRAEMRLLYERLYHAPPQPTCWRGLSPWEISWMDWEARKERNLKAR